MIRLYQIETNSSYLKDALIKHSLTQEFSKILFSIHDIPHIKEPINFFVGIGKLIDVGPLRCERAHLPLVRNGLISNFIDKVSRKIIGIRFGVNVLREHLKTQMTSYIISTDLIVDFEKIGQHQITIYGISAENYSLLDTSQPMSIAVIFANIGNIFEPVYIQSLKDVMLQTNFFPNKFISNLEATNLFNKQQLQFIRNDLKLIIGSETVNHMPINSTLKKELVRFTQSI